MYRKLPITPIIPVKTKFMIPSDPIILLSFVNTRLRDEYSDLDDLCASLGIDRNELEAKLNEVGFQYDSTTRQFR